MMLERLAGLDGRPATPPGLYLPVQLIDIDAYIAGLTVIGGRFFRMEEAHEPRSCPADWRHWRPGAPDRQMAARAAPCPADRHRRATGRARQFAAAPGQAEVVAVDLGRDDLGLAGQRFSMVISAFKDHAHASFRFAQERGIPCIALSEAGFEIAPLVAMHAHRPRSALMLMGHIHGALPAMIALGLSRRVAEVDSITIGRHLRPRRSAAAGRGAEHGAGPEGAAAAGPRRRTLALAAAGAGEPPDPPRRRRGCAGGGRWPGRRAEPLGGRRAIPAAGHGQRRTAPGTGGAPGHEVMIEIAGRAQDGAITTRRWLVTDPDGNVAFAPRAWRWPPSACWGWTASRRRAAGCISRRCYWISGATLSHQPIRG
jgi:hypothetical protein